VISRLSPGFLLCVAALALCVNPSLTFAAEPAVEPIAVSGIEGVTFLTQDPAALRSFYGEGAGFTEAAGAPGTTRFNVTVGTSHVDGVAAELTKRGIPLQWVGTDPKARVLEITDPAGDRIRVAEQASPVSSHGSARRGFSDHLQHMGFAVDRKVAQETIAFYRDRLGLPEAVRMNNSDGRLGLVKFRLPGPGRDLIELIFSDFPINKWAAGAFDHVNFEVSDISDTYRTLHKGGLTTLARHYPAVNGEHFWAINLNDPELTRIEIQVLTATAVPMDTISTVDAKPLFDGKTLEGWEGNLSNWRAEDGAIVAGRLDAKQPHNEFLATTRDFKDFELTLQYKVVGTGPFVNGGVQFWSQRIPDNFEVSGYQADLGAGTDGNLYDESRRGRNLAVADPALRARVLKEGEWNDYRIRAEGAHIQIWLNGVKTVDYVETDASVPQYGKFALQIHGSSNTKVSYRGLTLEDLP
jgi:catechol 2,3-dioxygenase-like lactoylglutathione lyase family enzyme